MPISFEGLGLPNPNEAILSLLSDDAFVFESIYIYADINLSKDIYERVVDLYVQRFSQSIRFHVDQANDASSLASGAIPLSERGDWFAHRLGLLGAYEISRAGIYLAEILDGLKK